MAVSLTHTTVAVGTNAGNGEIAKAQWNEGHTLSMATARLLGRTTSGTGAAEEISVGSGLTLSSGSLTATAGAGSWVEISRATASNSATIDFTGLSTTYDDYMVAIYNAIPVSDAYLYLRTSTNNGSSYSSGASDYGWALGGSYGYNNAAVAANESLTEDSVIKLGPRFAASSVANDGGISACVYITRPASGSKRFTCFSQSSAVYADEGTPALSYVYATISSGFTYSTTAVNAIRFLFSTGNVSSGTFVLLGRKK